jgi:hypothetical protein
MAMTEEQRHELDTRLEGVIGMGPATTLMEGMPPVGGADVATKRDLEHLEARIELAEARFDASLQRSLREQNNRFMLGVGAMLTVLLAVQELLARI